jgi:hypothetical protein
MTKPSAKVVDQQSSIQISMPRVFRYKKSHDGVGHGIYIDGSIWFSSVSRVMLSYHRVSWVVRFRVLVVVHKL